MKFEWDLSKEYSNQRKHGISFEEAKSVFYDENAKLIDDPDHSGGEDRFIILGLSANFKILTVCHCYRGDDDAIRIISARKANKSEMRFYKGEHYA